MTKDYRDLDELTENSYDLDPYNDLIRVGGEYQLVQGRTDDELIVMRPVDELFECERDNIQAMLGDDK